MNRVRSVIIDDAVRDVLLQAVVEGNVLRITQQLDRDLYVRVNKILDALGGKWNRKLRGHVFDGDPSQKIMDAVSTGQAVDVKKSVEFFETPPAVGHLLIQEASIQPGMKVLEPSGGHGALADLVREVCPDCELHVVEPEKENRRILKEKGHRLVGSDFMKFKKKGYDRVVMNPPFSNQQDVDHVLRAYKALAPGGRLVSVMSPSWRFRTNKKSQAFREFVEELGASVIDLPAESFRESGTLVNSVMVTLDKEA